MKYHKSMINNLIEKWTIVKEFYKKSNRHVEQAVNDA